MVIDNNKLKQIVIEAINDVLLVEYATDRGTYINYCLNQSSVVYTHLAKICLFEHDEVRKMAVNHWKTEIITQIYDILKIKLKNDNKGADKAKRAFVDGFLYSRLGEHFCDYNDIISYFYDALEDEGLKKDEIQEIPFQKIAILNKDRIIKFLYSISELTSYSNNPIELKDKIKNIVNEF